MRPPGTPGRKLGLWAALMGAAVFIGLAAYLRTVQEGIVSAARAQALLDADKPARPLAEVTQAVRAMKLVTVEIDTKVKVERGDSSWRGDVQASIEVPVRLSFGTDLSKMESDWVTFSELIGGRGGYVVRVPRATRIATEVFSEKEAPLVRTGWLRLRSRAGEYYLSQARKDASDQARELVLLPQDAKKVEERTSEQVAALVKSMVGQEADVRVVFKDEP
jgi:Protein of unknown function (DUF4230)